MRENKGRPDVLRSFDAAPSKLGNVPYLDPSSAAPRNTQGKAEEGLSIVNKTRCTPEVTERQGTFTALWSRFHPTKRTRKKVSHFDLSTVFRQRELRSHNGKEGQVLYGILVMSNVCRAVALRTNQYYFSRLITATPPVPHLSFDSAPSNLGNRLEGQERGGDEGKSYLAGIGHEQCPATDT